jgi:hypothetical protein
MRPQELANEGLTTIWWPTASPRRLLRPIFVMEKARSLNRGTTTSW